MEPTPMNTPLQLRGVIVPLFTPLSDNGSRVDEISLERHTEWLIARGVRGLMPCGTTGEFPLLSSQERKAVVRRVVEVAAGRATRIIRAVCWAVIGRTRVQPV